ncbi:protease SohB [Pasteurella canis]|nr:protease SohB [Pasteurella canis]
MWSEIAAGYAVFILEILTILLVIAGIGFMIFVLKQHKAKAQGELLITDLSQDYNDNTKKLRDFHLSEDALKQVEKAQKKTDKEKAKIEKVKRKKEKRSI